MEEVTTDVILVMTFLVVEALLAVLVSVVILDLEVLVSVKGEFEKNRLQRVETESSGPY